MSKRLIRHQHSIVVDADAETVWALACAVPRYPEWVGVTLAMLESVDRAATGATYAERTRVLGPITTVGHWTVVRCDDAALFQRHECRDEPGPVKEMWLEMQVVADGSRTRFDLAIGCCATAGPLTRPLASVLSRKFRSGNDQNVRRFAALAERAVRSG
ncbi:SRPBCC family protein [Nocardioides immobilis]|uniref:SRPBCC family protein n=1 Tax=Nocardioides immobilis TaxID=2049295 RepID=A0A417XX30_9ACTN|nr:SRPBCC family protein [Nocardioides immobilis]RHW24933.1 SRPBCC family protein [Nocardioides immobilis]